MDVCTEASAVIDGGSGAAVGAVLVPWPAGARRRAELARTAVPCLLVVAPGAAIPTVGPGEDWVWRTADERDVARRLGHLAAAGRPVPAATPAGALPPPVPAGLDDAAARVAACLLARPRRLVSRPELEAAVSGPPPALATVVRGIRRALRPSGWTVVRVGDGYLVEPRGDRP